MKMPSLEDVASRWTFGHTAAVVAWVVVVVLALVLFSRHASDSYPATDRRKVYAGENVTFMYPENWIIGDCTAHRDFLELPGTIKANYKGRQAYAFVIRGGGSYTCIKDRPERFDIFPETIMASENPCIVAESTKGERLDNGLYLQLAEQDGEVFGLSIRQNSCFAPQDAYLLNFSFVDPEAEDNDISRYGPPRVKKDALLSSRQYQDIRTLAESFRY